MAFGQGLYTYEVVDNWAKRPRGWPFVEVADVATDAQDNVFVLSRSPHPVMIFDRDGSFLDWWGGDLFIIPHSITIAPDGSVWCSDTGDHTLKHFTPDGRLLRVLGTRFLHAPEMSGQPFNRPTHLAVAKNGDLYISDGYGNARIHVYSADGTLRFSWGEPGKGSGEFRQPHSVTFDKHDRVYVCDRMNDRIQIFTLQGQFVTEWRGLHGPKDLTIDQNNIVYVAEIEHRVSIWSLEGKLLARWGDEGKSQEAGLFIAPHGIAVDSAGTVYVGEVAESHDKIDRGSRSVQKFVGAG